MENKTHIANAGNGSVTLGKPTIPAFIAAVQAGVDSWVAAGEILVALVNEDRDTFRKITKANPFITEATLEAFFQIGNKALYPMAMLLPRHAFNEVRRMSYVSQVAICSTPVEVVTRLSGDKLVVIRKSIAELSPAECRLALYRKGNISVQRQIENLKAPPRKPVAAPAPKPKIIFRAPKEIARFAVRRAIGGGFAFEKTMACGSHEQTIILNEGKALIVLKEWPKE